MKLVMVSGGFDPLHLGHINLFVAARALGDELGVIVNGDSYVSKKHKPLMPQFDRAEIIRRLDCVKFTSLNERDDGNVSVDIRLFRPSVYAVGPDYPDAEKLDEYGACREVSAEIVCLKDLVKDRSSSIMLSEVRAEPKWVNPPVTVSVLLRRRDRGAGVLVTTRGQEDRQGLLQLVGGFLEVGESLEDAALREVREEVNVRVQSLLYMGSWKDMYSDGRELVSVYFMADTVEEPVPSEECPELTWVTSVPAREFAYPSDQWALEKYFGGTL